MHPRVVGAVWCGVLLCELDRYVCGDFGVAWRGVECGVVQFTVVKCGIISAARSDMV